MKYFVTIAVIFLSLYFSGCISFKRGPHKAYNHIRAHDVTFDAIIVPGIPFENGVWDSVMKARVMWAYILFKNGVTRNIIFSGNAVYSNYYESKIMGLYAQALGVPKKHILYDTLARHSTENVYYSYLIAKDKGFKTIALTTDPVQSSLLRRFTATRFRTVIYHMPFVMDSLRKYNGITPSINPETAKKQDFKSITEEESRFRRLFGTIGSDINWKQYDNRLVPAL